MAFDKNQLVMHQLQVKARRLESGLERIVKAMSAGGTPHEGDVGEAYYYALGCLGGDYLKKILFRTDAFERVVTELRDGKMMKKDVADKNIAVWREKHGSCGMDVSARESESVCAECTAGDGGIEIHSVKTGSCADAGRGVSDESPAKGGVFGERDENGDIVPVKKDVLSAFATPPAVESKSGVQPSGLSSRAESSGFGRNAPIFCY